MHQLVKGLAQSIPQTVLREWGEGCKPKEQGWSILSGVNNVTSQAKRKYSQEAIKDLSHRH